MFPTISSGDEVVLLRKAYECGSAIQVGDIVSYHPQGRKDPMIKRVIATPKDEVFFNDLTLIVNGKVFTSPSGKPYPFTAREKAMIGLYLNEKKISFNAVILLSDNPTVGTDSRSFGAVSMHEISGKFLVGEKDKKPQRK